jgi:hypothetical protein
VAASTLKAPGEFVSIGALGAADAKKNTSNQTTAAHQSRCRNKASTGGGNDIFIEE